MADGTIIIETEINDSGAKKGNAELKAEARKLAAEYEKSGMSSSKAYKKAWDEIKKDSQSGSSSVKSSINSISDIAKKGAAMLGGLFVVDKIKDFVSEVTKVGISYNAMSEQSQVAWGTILGSQEKATKMMKDIEQYAARTPFSKMGVDEMAKQLTNAGFSGQAMFDQLTKIGDMGSAFGIQEASLKEMVRQYAQVQQSGVAYTEDLNILQDRGIPIYKALAETLGVPVAETRKLASEGKITSEVYNKAMDSIASNTAGAMDAQSKTFNGMMSTVKDNLTMLAGKLAEPMFEKFKGNLETILPKIEDFTKLVGTEGIGGAISQTFPALKPLVDLLSDIGNVIVNTVIPAINTFGSWVLDNIGPITFLASAISGAVLAFKTMNFISSTMALIQGLAAVFGILEVATLGETAAQWAANLAFLACPITWIVIAIGALVAAFIYLWNTSEGFRNFWLDMWNSILSFFTETIPAWIENIKQWFIGLPAWFGQIWESIKQWCINKWNEIWAFFTETIPNWISSIGAWFNELPYKIGYALGQIIGKLILWGANMWNYLVTNVPIWINNVITWFSELPGRIWTWLVDVVTRIIEWGTQIRIKANEIAMDFINKIIEWFKELPNKIWTWLSNTFSKIVQWGTEIKNQAIQIASNFINNIIEWFQQLPTKIWTWLVYAKNKVVNFGTDLWAKAKEIGSNFVTNLIDTVKSLPGQFMDIGTNIVKGVWDGILGMGTWIKDKVSGFFSGIVQGAKDALGIKSPSRVMRDKVGKWILPGVGDGMDKTFPELEDNVEDKMATLTHKMKAKVEYETSHIVTGITAKSNHDIDRGSSESSVVTNDNGVVQNINFYEPVESPSETARRIKQVGRDIVFG